MATPITLTERATERSTFAVDVSFVDEDGAAVTPSAATWTLTDMRGTVINSREDVTISPLASTVTVVLSGADLAVPGELAVIRCLTVEATYTSDLGAGLPLKQAIWFAVDPLVAVAP